MTGSLLNLRIASPDRKEEANDRHRRGLPAHPQHLSAAGDAAEERLLRGSLMLLCRRDAAGAIHRREH